jgi:hypothetical protein
MVSAVRSRPNHYELLGLAPTASAEEIRNAFAARMKSPRAMADAAQIGIAFATLGNPARRADYDRSLGMTEKPQPPRWNVSATQQQWTPFIARPPEPKAIAESQRQPLPGQPGSISPIGAALQELARPAPLAGPAPPAPAAPQIQMEAASSETADEVIDYILDFRRADVSLHKPERATPYWRRAGLALGGFLLGAGVLGAVVGFSVKENEGSSGSLAMAEPARAAPGQQPSVSIPLPAPRGAPAELKAKLSPVADVVPTRPQPIRPRHPRAPSVAQGLDAQNQTAIVQADNGATPQVAEESQVAQATPASMPLSNGLVARTIEKIGYDCGQVASTEPVRAGVFKVTCTSGQAYQASPVRGRYHFRRLGGR